MLYKLTISNRKLRIYSLILKSAPWIYSTFAAVIVKKDVMEIKLATKQDVPKLLELRQKAFGALYDELGINPGSLAENASLDDAYEEFDECTTLKAINDKGCIVGSVQGNVAYGLLFIGRLMVLPECQNNGIGRRLLQEIQNLIPHDKAWLYTCQEVNSTYNFYIREGFRIFEREKSSSGLTWAYMEK